MRGIPQEFIPRKNKVANPSPWLWLFRIKASLDPLDDNYFYLVNNTECVELNGFIYDPFDIRLDGIRSSVDGDVQPITLEITNINQQLTTFIELGSGLIGGEVLVTLINSEMPFTGIYQETFEITGCSITNDSIRLEAGYFAIVRREFPGIFYSKNLCRFEFTSTQCGIDPSIPNPGEICTKRLENPFGCQDWGDREVAALFPRQHPQRFGAFPFLPFGLTFEV